MSSTVSWVPLNPSGNRSWKAANASSLVSKNTVSTSSPSSPANTPSSASICSGDASPPAHVGLGESIGHRKTETSTRSYQSSLSLSIWIWSSAEAPTKVRDTKVTRTTEIVIARLRRRPDPISARMN
ncbi:hypothetical protein D3C74_419680 [compost metagenome]